MIKRINKEWVEIDGNIYRISEINGFLKPYTIINNFVSIALPERFYLNFYLQHRSISVGFDGLDEAVSARNELIKIVTGETTVEEDIA